jgi:hypothetical protein
MESEGRDAALCAARGGVREAAPAEKLRSECRDLTKPEMPEFAKSQGKMHCRLLNEVVE